MGNCQRSVTVMHRFYRKVHKKLDLPGAKLQGQEERLRPAFGFLEVGVQELHSLEQVGGLHTQAGGPHTQGLHSLEQVEGLHIQEPLGEHRNLVEVDTLGLGAVHNQVVA